MFVYFFKEIKLRKDANCFLFIMSIETWVFKSRQNAKSSVPTWLITGQSNEDGNSQSMPRAFRIIFSVSISIAATHVLSKIGK